MDRLAEAGVTWAAQDTHPWQLFAMKLHEMFLGVLRDRKGADDEAGSLFPTNHRKEPRNTYPWHLLQLPQPRGVPTAPPVLGAIPREWQWGPDLPPMVIRWTTELQWLKMPPAERRRPLAHWQVSYMELALDFEAYAGRQLPPAQQSRFVGGEMPLQEKARVLRLITSLMGRAIGQDTILPAKMTNHCKTLIPMGAGLVMGLEGRPLFTRPLEVSRHLQRLRTYGEERWARRQRSKQAQKKARRDRRRAPSRNATQRRRRTGGGARQKEGPSALRCTTARTSMRNPQYRMAGGTPPFQVVDTGPENGSQEPHTIRFTPQHARTLQRRPETHKRRRKTWVCEAHGHPPCRACALAHRGVRYCCARGHQGHPRVPAMCPPAAGRAPTPLRRLGARRASQRTPGRGEGGQPPAPKRRVTHTPVRGGGAHTRGAQRPEPVPPPARGDEATEGRDTSPGRPAGQTSTPAGAAWACRH